MDPIGSGSRTPRLVAQALPNGTGKPQFTVIDGGQQFKGPPRGFSNQQPVKLRVVPDKQAAPLVQPPPSPLTGTNARQLLPTGGPEANGLGIGLSNVITPVNAVLPNNFYNTFAVNGAGLLGVAGALNTLIYNGVQDRQQNKPPRYIAIAIAETGSVVQVRYKPDTGMLLTKGPDGKETSFMRLPDFAKHVKVNNLDDLNRQLREQGLSPALLKHLIAALYNSDNGGAYPAINAPAVKTPTTRTTPAETDRAPTTLPKTPVTPIKPARLPTPEEVWAPVMKAIDHTISLQPKLLQPFLRAEIVKQIQSNLQSDRTQDHGLALVQKLAQTGKIGTVSFQTIYRQAEADWQAQAAVLINRINVTGVTAQERQKLLAVITAQISQNITSGKMDGSLQSIDRWLTNLQSSPALLKSMGKQAGIYAQTSERVTPKEVTHPSRQKPAKPPELPPVAPSTNPNKGTNFEELARQNQVRELERQKQTQTAVDKTQPTTGPVASSGNGSTGATGTTGSSGSTQELEWSAKRQTTERVFLDSQIANKGKISPKDYFEENSLRHFLNEFQTRNGSRGVNPQLASNEENPSTRFYFIHDAVIHGIWMGNEFKGWKFRASEIAEDVLGIYQIDWGKDEQRAFTELAISEMERAAEDPAALAALRDWRPERKGFSAELKNPLPEALRPYPTMVKKLVVDWAHAIQSLSINGHLDLKMDDIVFAYLYFQSEMVRLAKMNNMTAAQFKEFLRTAPYEELYDLRLSRHTSVTTLGSSWPVPDWAKRKLNNPKSKK